MSLEYLVYNSFARLYSIEIRFPPSNYYNMILILDGYNILKQVLTSSRITQTERDAFVRLMGKYAQKKNHKMIIFFDGGPHEKPYESRLNGAHVWYSGSNLTADELIIQHAPSYKNKDAALITGDRELINRTAPSLKVVFEPLFFYNQVKSTFLSTTTIPDTITIIKTSESTNEELDKLMREAALLPTLHREDNNNSLASKHITPSKKERNFEKNKKKL